MRERAGGHLRPTERRKRASPEAHFRREARNQTDDYDVYILNPTSHKHPLLEVMNVHEEYAHSKTHQQIGFDVLPVAQPKSECDAQRAK